MIELLIESLNDAESLALFRQKSYLDRAKRKAFVELVHDMTDRDFLKLLQKLSKLFSKIKTTLRNLYKSFT